MPEQSSKYLSMIETLLDITPSMQPVEPIRTLSRSAALRYAILLAAAPFLFVAVVCWVGSTEWFLLHDAYPGARVMGYGEQLHDKNCQILLYGDSTALTELDPSIISARTGLTACNISEGAPVQEISGSNFVLDEYLRHNARPLYLVSAWSATWFRPETPRDSGYAPEGVIYAMHYDHSGFGLFLLHPQHLISFIGWVAKRLVADIDERLSGEHARVWAHDERASRAQRLGIWTYRSPPETSCTRVRAPIPLDIAANRESVQAFRQRYSVGGTHVIIDVSAVANCDFNLQRYRAATAGLSDNSLQVLPIRAFNQGDVHISPEGARYMSNQIADQILALMKDKRSTIATP